MPDKETKETLKYLEDNVNDAIDKLIVKRDSLIVKDKQHQDYRYVIKKLEHALGMVHKAEERVNGQ